MLLGCRQLHKGHSLQYRAVIMGRQSPHEAKAVRSRPSCSRRPENEGWHLQGPLGAELLHHPELQGALQAGAALSLAACFVLPQYAPLQPMCCCVPHQAF